MTQELGNQSHSGEFKQCYLLRCTKNMYFDLQLCIYRKGVVNLVTEQFATCHANYRRALAGG